MKKIRDIVENYEDIFITAKYLLNNSENIVQNFYIQQELKDFVKDFPEYGEETEFQDMLAVIRRICEEGYDIKDNDFQLVERPHPFVYVFSNGETDWFDIYTHHFNGGKEYAAVGYIGKDHNIYDAESITEAIKKYTVL